VARCPRRADRRLQGPRRPAHQGRQSQQEGATAMIEHGQGYEDSGRPMMVVAEVWPVAADELGLWLLSGDGPRPSLPVMDDAEPFDYAEMELMQAGMWATTKILHSTSWRGGHGDLVVTYLAVVGGGGLVLSPLPVV